MSILDLMMQQQALQVLGKMQEQPKGLLGMSTPRQMGLLGATQGVQPYMGYTDKPVSLGQVLAGAGAGYASGLQTGQKLDLEKSLGTLGALGTIKDIMKEPTPPGSIKVIDAKTGKPGFVPKGQELAKDVEGNPLYYPYEGGQIGYTVTTGPEGTSITPTLVGYGDQTQTPTIEKKTKQTLEQNILESTGQFDEVFRIEERFDPRFLEIPTKLTNYFNSLVEKFGGDLTPQEADDLAKFTDFQRSSYQALNKYIKYITGAQMSEAEAKRLTKGFPNPDKDSPTQFLTKLNSLQEELLLIRARSNYFLNNPQEFIGIDPNDPYKQGNSLENKLPFEDMKSTIVNKFKQFKNEIANDPNYQGFNETQITNIAKQLTSQFFGVDLNKLTGKK